MSCPVSLSRRAHIWTLHTKVCWSCCDSRSTWSLVYSVAYVVLLLKHADQPFVSLEGWGAGAGQQTFNMFWLDISIVPCLIAIVRVLTTAESGLSGGIGCFRIALLQQLRRRVRRGCCWGRRRHCLGDGRDDLARANSILLW